MTIAPAPSPLIIPPTIMSPILSALMANIAGVLGGNSSGGIPPSPGAFSFPISLIFMGL